jgi:hypothetical protein
MRLPCIGRSSRNRKAPDSPSPFLADTKDSPERRLKSIQRLLEWQQRKWQQTESGASDSSREMAPCRGQHTMSMAESRMVNH